LHFSTADSALYVEEESMVATFRLTRIRIAVCVFACVSATACGKSGPPLQPSAIASASAESVSTADGEQRAAPAAVGEQQAALEAVRRATAAFHDVDLALAAGYTSPLAGICEQSAAGAMGVHSPNGTLVRDPAVVMERPEVLLYLPQADGTHRLVGVEYFQTVLVRNLQTRLVAPWRLATRWDDPQFNGQYELVNQAPTLFGQTFNGPMAGHTPTMPWHYELHVWAWAPNPSGLFASWNPSLSCE
jgi:hypothetical protein